jgi:hypothetical protein
MCGFFEKGEKVLNFINKYMLLVGGTLSLYNSFFSSTTTWEILGWACGGMYGLSGFTQIVELEKKIKKL